MTARNYLRPYPNGDLQVMFFGLMVSIFFHVALAVLVLFAPTFKSGRTIASPAMNVSLVAVGSVDFRAPKAADVRPGKLPANPAEPGKKAVKTGSVSKAPAKAVENAHPEIKRSLKKKTYKTGKVLEEAVKKIERQVAEERPDSVSKAIERIREKEASAKEEPEATNQAPEDPGEAREDAAGSSAAASGNAAGREFDQIDLYKLEVMYRIEKNWAYSEPMAGRKSDLESLLVIQVMPDGEIQDVWFEKKSGNSHLDDSAYKAVLKSNPLPPLPSGFNRKFFTVGIRFTPSGLQ